MQTGFEIKRDESRFEGATPSLHKLEPAPFSDTAHLLSCPETAGGGTKEQCQEEAGGEAEGEVSVTDEEVGASAAAPSEVTT